VSRVTRAAEPGALASERAADIDFPTLTRAASWSLIYRPRPRRPLCVPCRARRVTRRRAKLRAPGAGLCVWVGDWARGPSGGDGRPQREQGSDGPQEIGAARPVRGMPSMLHTKSVGAWPALKSVGSWPAFVDHRGGRQRCAHSRSASAHVSMRSWVVPSAGEEAHGGRPTDGLLGASGSTGAHGRMIRVRRGAGAEVRVELGGGNQRDLVNDACRHTRAAGARGIVGGGGAHRVEEARDHCTRVDGIGKGAGAQGGAPRGLCLGRPLAPLTVHRDARSSSHLAVARVRHAIMELPHRLTRCRDRQSDSEHQPAAGARAELKAAIFARLRGALRGRVLNARGLPGCWARYGYTVWPSMRSPKDNLLAEFAPILYIFNLARTVRAKSCILGHAPRTAAEWASEGPSAT
jgi:hypothetical protein